VVLRAVAVGVVVGVVADGGEGVGQVGKSAIAHAQASDTRGSALLQLSLQLEPEGVVLEG
jgi:hypothetical protein